MSDNPIEVTTVPREDGRCHLAYIVWERNGNWVVGQTAHAGMYNEERSMNFSPVQLLEPGLTWMGDDEFYGLRVPLHNPTRKQLTQALAIVGPLTSTDVIAAAHDQDRRGIKCRPFRLRHLVEMITHFWLAKAEGSDA